MITTELLESRRYLATFSVTNTNDTGTGSLRQAMLDAAASAAADVIAFNIPGTGVHTIKPASSFHVLKPGDSLDGTTQPGYAGAPRIEIDGSLQLQNATFWLSGISMERGAILKGLAVINFRYHGVVVNLSPASELPPAVIQGSYIGLRADGITAAGNVNAGIAAWSRTTIGGPLPAQRNVISGNGLGILAAIDTGSAAEEFGALNGTTIQGNYIGTDASGTLDRGNNTGISTEIYLNSTLTIGGTAAGEANRIAFNKHSGVCGFAWDEAPNGGVLTIRGNEIFSNGGAGIDTEAPGVNFDDNPDAGELNRPVITEIIDEGANWRVKGTLPPRPNQTFTIDFYANADHDLTGYGEGAKWVGSQNFLTDASGVGLFDLSVAKVAGMPVISATATDSRGETSEFSNTRIPAIPFGIVSGSIFEDLNENGTFEANIDRSGTASRVYVDLNNDGGWQQGEPTTNSTMLTSFRIYDVPVGTHTLRVVPLNDHYIITTPNGANGIPVTVSPYLEASKSVGIAKREVSVKGRLYWDYRADGINSFDQTLSAQTAIWADLNTNGQLDSGEPQTTTATNGTYTLALLPGSYTIRSVVPSGYRDIGQNTKTVNLPSTGDSASNVDFAFDDFASEVWLHTFFDANDNGVLDGTEKVEALPSLVYLDVNKNGTYDGGTDRVGSSRSGTPAVIFSITAGEHRFNALNTDEYRFTTTLPATVTLGQYDNVDLYVGYRTISKINVFVYEDANNNSQQDTGEPQLADRIVYLDLNQNGQLDAAEPTRVTTATGFVTFDRLDPATYTVRTVVPNGSVAVRDWSTVDVSNSANSFNVALGTRVGTPPPTASISGVTFNDNNANSIFDTGDALISGKTVFLDANQNGKLDTGEKSATSDTAGKYTFGALAGGTYYVRRVFPSGYTYSNPPLNLTLTNAQAFAGANIGSVAVGTVVTPPGDNPPPPPPPTDQKNASIAGRTYNDNNANGVFDAGDAIITGKTVFLDANNNGKLDTGERSTKSSSTGAFSFTGLAAGTYYVRRVFPTGYKASNPPRDYTLTAGQVITGADIGSVTSSTVVTPPGDNPPPPPPPTDPKTASISGFLFWDSDRDGLFDTGESYQTAKTVFIDLDDDNILDSNEARVTSDSQGRFTFGALSAGTYVVKRVVPSGYKITSPKASITLTAGQIFSGVAIGTNTI